MSAGRERVVLAHKCAGTESAVRTLRGSAATGATARSVPLALLVLALAGGLALCEPAAAQEFSRFLQCAGTFAAGNQTAPAHVDFALRFNNRTALIQRSNILPVGERLAYVPSPAAYSMTYRLPRQGTQVIAIPGWFSSTILIKFPDLRRLNQIRLSIDRQNGALEGVMLNEEEQPLATFAMQCKSASEEEVGAPKF
jgi:hypothetical protein